MIASHVSSSYYFMISNLMTFHFNLKAVEVKRFSPTAIDFTSFANTSNNDVTPNYFAQHRGNAHTFIFCGRGGTSVTSHAFLIYDWCSWSCVTSVDDVNIIMVLYNLSQIQMCAQNSIYMSFSKISIL